MLLAVCRLFMPTYVLLTSPAMHTPLQNRTSGGCVNCTRPGATNSGPIAVWAWNTEMLATLSVDIKLEQDEYCGLGVDGPDYSKAFIN